MEKKNKKEKITFTLDEKLKETFETYIDKNLLNKSRVIEKLIEEYVSNKIVYKPNLIELRNKIIELDSIDNVENEINLVIDELKNNGASKKYMKEFFKQLNTLFLTYLVTEGEDSKFENIKKVREILKKWE